MSGPTAILPGLQSTARPLLSTRLFVPPPRATLVSRPRLIARLEQGMERSLTLVSAPAGSGKTSLVSGWRAAAGREFPLAWLSLDPEDNDPAIFLAYLFAACRALKPDLAESSTGMFAAGPQAARRSLMTLLINELGGLSSPSALVLDDYHGITSQEIHADLTFLLDNLPPHLHLFLLTQADPPLPLARLRARDQLVEIRSGDLSFTAGEAETFFNRSMGLELSGEQAALLERRTEGWIAGMQLAALALQSRRSGAGPAGAAGSADLFLNAFSGSHPYIASYLTEEVLDHQPEEVRAFILQTSILERMTGDLCDRITERSDGQAWLRRLEEANLFLIPLDEEAAGKTGAGWYRYHHLFRELLLSRLQQTAPEQVPALHRKAAQWFEQNGLAPQAIEHALAAGDQDQAARLIEQHAMARLLRGDSVTVLHWIDPVSPLLEERPWLSIYQSWALLITGEMERLDARLKMLASWIERQGPGSGAEAAALDDHLTAIRALAAGRSGRAQEAISLARQALERMPEQAGTLWSLITFTLGDQLWSSGDLAGARGAFEAASIDRRAEGGQIAVLALSSLGVLLAEQGELHRAGETFQAVLEMTARPEGDKQPAAAVACLGLAGLAYERNDLEAAGDFAREALELGGRWGNPDTLANAHLLEARRLHAQGDPGGALQSLRQAETLARGQGVTPWSGLRIAAFRVQLWLEQGDLEAAQRWTGRQNLRPEDEILYQSQAAYLTLARVRIAQGQVEAAEALLERLLAQFEGSGQKGRALQARLLQALARSVRGDIPGALTALRPALGMAEQEDYRRAFLDEGAAMAELLRHAGSHGIYPKTVALLLAGFEPGASPGESQPLIEPLTGRELEVLRLIAEGLSNQAIAARLVVALGTVKTHTASLYRKLDVTSRTQAVARANELGLL